MENKKLVIQPQRYGGESTVISVRLSKKMLEEVDQIASETGRTRNELIGTFIEYAMDNLEIEDRRRG